MQLMFRPPFDAVDVPSCSVHPSTQFMLHDRWCEAAVQSSGGRHAFDAIAVEYLAVIIAIKAWLFYVACLKRILTNIDALDVVLDFG